MKNAFCPGKIRGFYFEKKSGKNLRMPENLV